MLSLSNKEKYAARIDEVVSDHYFDAGRQSSLHEDIMLRMTPNEKLDQMESERELIQEKQNILARLKQEQHDTQFRKAQQLISQYGREKSVYLREITDSIIVDDDTMKWVFNEESRSASKLVAREDVPRAFTRKYYDGMTFSVFKMNDLDLGDLLSDIPSCDDIELMEVLNEYEEPIKPFMFFLKIPSRIFVEKGVGFTDYDLFAIVIYRDEQVVSSAVVELSRFTPVLNSIREASQARLDRTYNEAAEGDELDLEFSKKFGHMEKTAAWSVEEYDEKLVPSLALARMKENAVIVGLAQHSENEPFGADGNSDEIMEIDKNVYDSIEVPF